MNYRWVCIINCCRYIYIPIISINDSLLLFQLKVPGNCLPHYSDNDVPTLSLDADVGQSGACFHEGRFYQESDQWTTKDPCTMCYCQNGNVKCDTTTCPDLQCTNKAKNPSECCPVCSNSSSTQDNRGCMFGEKFHSAGSRFHPFLIPTGFDLCTECFCDPLLLEVKCTRQSNERLCCKNCVAESKAMADSENGTYFNDPGQPNDFMWIKPKVVVPYKQPSQVLAEGGCKNPANPSKPYENGQKFHPWLASLGEYKCVTCKCKVSLCNFIVRAYSPWMYQSFLNVSPILSRKLGFYR